MHSANDTPTAAGPKADSLKTDPPPKTAPPAPASTAKEATTLNLELEKIELAGYFKVREQYKDVDDVADTLKGKLGQLAPVLVRPVAGGKYELIAGYRRFHAAKKAGLKTISATVRVLDDHDAHLAALTENLVRRELNPMELAQAIESAIGHGKWLAKDLAKLLGKSEAWVSNHRKLRTLPEPVQAMIAAGELTPGHVEHALSKVERNKEATVELAKAIVKGDMNVRQAEREAREVDDALKEQAKLDEAVKDSKFKVCPRCKRPPREFHYRFKTAVECQVGHAWRPSDGKDPEVEEREKWERESGGHGSGMMRSKKKVPHNYEPTEYRIPASQDELARGVVKWLLETQGGKLEVDDSGWKGIAFRYKGDGPFPGHWRRFHGTAAEFKRDGYVRSELVDTSRGDQARAEARLKMERFLKTYVPQAAKRIPDVGLYGIGELTRKCHVCGKRVGPAPMRAVVKCPDCGTEVEMLRKRQEATAEQLGKYMAKNGPDVRHDLDGKKPKPIKKVARELAGKKTCKAKCPSCKRRCEKDATATSSYCGDIKTAEHEHDEHGDREGHKWKAGRQVHGWSLGAKKKAKKSKVSGRARSPASPSEKRKKKAGRKPGRPKGSKNKKPARYAWR